MTFIKDLIEIPDTVNQGDFVLRLTEGITDPEATIRQYQVTPNLAGCFGEALDLVKSALNSKSSKGTYLHGSFGSGKSHFMAILHLLLSGNETARRIPELAGQIVKHGEWTKEKKFLMVPYHLLGAPSLEERVLGGYVDYLLKTHPEAPIPPVYRSAELFKNALSTRANMGDERFFKVLNGGSSTTTSTPGGWGNLEAQWTPERFDSALQEPPASEESGRLVSALVATHFPAMKSTDQFVDLDHGLLAISQHAKDLGYDAVVLFLDELILWLASRAGDQAFLSREGEKVVKLVESSVGNRPIPLVSFIARQRDLSELVGKQIAGAVHEAFTDVLQHHDGRFSVIKLEDKNLPAIAEKRILPPKSATAKDSIDAEFERTAKQHAEVVSILQSREGTRDDFRQLYPFSPALVETLIAVSFLLQRERTALKVMAKLLSDQKHTLQLGQIVPVGDLFDYVSEGTEAFSTDMKLHFKNANSIYRQHLRPLLERDHKITFDEAEKLEWDDPKRKALRNDDRLIKTTLLASLVPAVEALKNLTPAKLAALNHGSIVSPLSGQEAKMVLAKFRNWAASAGQVKVQEGAGSQTLFIQLANIDAERILAKAQGQDNYGNRVRKIKELLFTAMGIKDPGELILTHEFTWRGTPRKADIQFNNVRLMPSHGLRADEDRWKILLDYPFDEDHSVNDDIQALDRFINSDEPTNTVVWLPSFFNDHTLEMLGTFVKLEHILKEHQFKSFVSDLAETDREIARSQLESQRGELRSQLLTRLNMAYGIQGDGEGYLDPANTLETADQFRSLTPEVTVQAPVAATLEQALEKMLDQVLSKQFPAHPQLDNNVSLTKGSITKVLEVMQAASRDENPSHLYDQNLRRPLFHLTNSLKLGEVSEQRLKLGSHWRDHFDRNISISGNPVANVGQLREWIDKPVPMGLPTILEDLIILTYAEQTNKVLQEHGTTIEVAPAELEDRYTLSEISLPSEATWTTASERLKGIFGLKPAPLLNLSNVNAMVSQLGEKVAQWLHPAKQLHGALSQVLQEHVPELDTTADRLVMAAKAEALLNDLNGQNGHALLERLAKFPLEVQPVTLSKSLSSAEEVSRVLQSTAWDTFASLKTLQNSAAAEVIRKDLLNLLEQNEYLEGLAEKLPKLQSRAINAIMEVAQTVSKHPDTPDSKPAEITIPPSTRPGRLKKLYRSSQIKDGGDILPEWLDEETQEALLQETSVASSDGSEPTTIVLGPLYRALVELDAQAKVDLKAGTLELPRFGKTLSLSVDEKHLNPDA
jgi:hypothetical protein